VTARLGRLFRVGFPVAVAAFLAVLATGAAFPGYAEAHGLIGRGDLPLPDWLLAWGATLLLIGSFAGLVLLWQQPKLEGDTWRAIAPRFSALLLHPLTQTLFGLLSVGLLVLVVYSGLNGTEAPDRNFSVTFVFVTFWLGLVLLSVLFGSVFDALSPWRAIGRGVSALFSLVAGQRAPAPLSYPKRLGRWPAAVGLVGFLWFELVWGQSGFAAAGVSPHDVAVAAIVYSVVTFVGMALYGVDRWHERAETFSVYFGMFATISPLEVRDGRLGRRRVFERTTGWAMIPGSLAVVLIAIGGTSFDGAQEGALNDAITSTFQTFTDGGMSPVTALRLTNSLYFAGSLLVVAGIFWAGIEGMRIVGTRRSSRELGRLFAHAFIPIALAYLVAHYFSLVAFQEQAQFTYLLSDPLGDGSNIFGTANSAIDYTLIGATTIQWVQFASIVLGHATALALGHDRALATFGGTREAWWSQLWMLAVMLIFSTLGLYLLSQANA
jgi:hypothetical protein